MVRPERLYKLGRVSELDDVVIRSIVGIGPHCGRTPGFPSPALDYEQHRINLTKELVPNPEYTELVRAYGDCCIDRFITDGTLVLIDYTEIPNDWNLVYVRVGDEDLIRVFRSIGGRIEYHTANHTKKYPIIHHEDGYTEIRGVVIQTINDPRKAGGRP